MDGEYLPVDGAWLPYSLDTSPDPEAAYIVGAGKGGYLKIWSRDVEWDALYREVIGVDDELFSNSIRPNHLLVPFNSSSSIPSSLSSLSSSSSSLFTSSSAINDWEDDWRWGQSAPSMYYFTPRNKNDTDDDNDDDNNDDDDDARIISRSRLHNTSPSHPPPHSNFHQPHQLILNNDYEPPAIRNISSIHSKASYLPSSTLSSLSSSSSSILQRYGRQQHHFPMASTGTARPFSSSSSCASSSFSSSSATAAAAASATAATAAAHHLRRLRIVRRPDALEGRVGDESSVKLKDTPPGLYRAPVVTLRAHERWIGKVAFCDPNQLYHQVSGVGPHGTRGGGSGGGSSGSGSFPRRGGTIDPSSLPLLMVSCSDAGDVCVWDTVGLVTQGMEAVTEWIRRRDRGRPVRDGGFAVYDGNVDVDVDIVGATEGEGGGGGRRRRRTSNARQQHWDDASSTSSSWVMGAPIDAFPVGFASSYDLHGAGTTKKKKNKTILYCNDNLIVVITVSVCTVHRCNSSRSVFILL